MMDQLRYSTDCLVTLNMLFFHLLESEGDKKPTQALQLGFELALKERDAVLRENARAIEERDRYSIVSQEKEM